MHAKFQHWIGLTIAVAAMFTCGKSIASDGVVGPGNCNESGFSTVLAIVDGSGGGTITFACGTATITLSGHKEVAHAVTIDGGGTITLDGGTTSAFFQIYFSAHLKLKGLTLRHGAYVAGHNVLENFGILELDHVRVLDNASSEPTLINYGTLDVRWSTFGNNSASSANADGGAINNSGGTATVANSTFAGNSVGRYGGAIYSDSMLVVSNSTFNANTAATGGGAIYQTGSGMSRIDYATIVGNQAPFGAGIYNEGSASSSLTISKSIVSANSTGNCDGVLASGGYNLSNDTGCGGVFTGPGDLLNQTLSMGALAANGGPTATMLPQAGNPAINHVPHALCQLPLDQRGAGRPFGSNCDSGAVEVGGTIDVIFYDGFE